jgi:DNA-binding transcriptional regulator GbsR (MarR family)
MVKYFLVKVKKDWYATNKDALKEFGDKPVCVLKVNKLIQENQRLIKELSQRNLAENYLKEAQNILKEAKNHLKEAKNHLEEVKRIFENK